MKKLLLTGLVLLMALGTMTGREYKGVTMADTVTVGEKTLVLNGMALRKKVVFKVYVAGLYLEKKTDSAEEVFDSTGIRRTVMHFLRKVGAEKINDAWKEGLVANTPNASSELESQFDKLCSYMEDVGDGDRIIFTWIPGTGTQIEIRGDIRGTIPGKPFADALFACWIGKEPGPGEDFKAELLGK
jgi:hypothetical protein